MEGPQAIDQRLASAHAFCFQEGDGNRRIRVRVQPDQGETTLFLSDYVDVPVVHVAAAQPNRPQALDLGAATEPFLGRGSESAAVVPPVAAASLVASSLLPTIAAEEEEGPSPPSRAAALAPGPATPHQTRASVPLVKVGLAMTEDLSMTFTGKRDLVVSVAGTLLLTSLSPAPPSARHAALGVHFLDPASQIADVEANLAALVVKAAPRGPIPETASPSSSSSFAETDFVCALPLDKMAAGLPLSLLQYHAKPTVRPIPVRIQQSRATLEGQHVHVSTQVTSNSLLKTGLFNIALSLELASLPGVEWGTCIRNASPAEGVTWRAPVLEWTLPPTEQLAPGKTLTFEATLPLPPNTVPQYQPGGPWPSSSSFVAHPLRTVFRARSRAALTKTNVRLHVVGQGNEEAPSCEVQQELRKYYVVTATQLHTTNAPY